MSTPPVQPTEPTQNAPEQSSHDTTPWSTLPEDLRSNPAITRHRDVASLGREYINLQGLIGRKGVLPPNDWDNAEDVKRFYGQIGVPESPDGYKLDDLEFGENWNPEVQTGMLQTMHELGLTERQVKGILSTYNHLTEGYLSRYQKMGDEARSAAEAELRKEYGHAYDEKLRRASEIFHNAWGNAAEELRTIRLENGQLLGDHPAFLRGLAKLGDMLGEDQFRTQESPGRRQTQTPEEAKRELDKLRADPEFMQALYDRSHPMHEAVVQQQDALYRALFPESTAR